MPQDKQHYLDIMMRDAETIEWQGREISRLNQKINQLQQKIRSKKYGTERS